MMKHWAPPNPWGLTTSQLKVMEVLSKLGCDKLVANELGVSIKTIESHMGECKRRMGARNRVLAVVKYVRWSDSGSGAA